MFVSGQLLLHLEVTFAVAISKTLARKNYLKGKIHDVKEV